MVKNLKFLRNKKGVSQQQLADVIGVTQQSVNKYENHSVEPDIYTLIKIADYFETTIDYLVGRVGDDGQDENRITNEEKTMIYNFRKLNADEKQLIRLCIKNGIARLDKQANVRNARRSVFCFIH